MSDLLSDVRKVADHLSVSDDEATAWVRGHSRAIEDLVRLPGDASTRRYYRLRSGHRSFVLMRMEPFLDQGAKLPFLVVQRHLAAGGVDVPEILDADPERGIILLEDLGDVTLLRRLQDVASADLERHLYSRVIDELVQLQVNCSPRRRPAPIDAYGLRFDHEKLMWEINFTIEHFYTTYLKRELHADDRRTLESGFSEICGILAGEPTVFTHRDFHSRNVMVTPRVGAERDPRESREDKREGLDDRLVMIDFQDARMGPAQYDLASLLRDSYYQLEEAQIDRLLDYYIVRWEALTGEQLDRTHFRTIFDLMSVQRNFKAIGSFASFLNRRGNATYLKYIGNTFENIRRTLLRYPRYAGLRETLFHYYYF